MPRVVIAYDDKGKRYKIAEDKAIARGLTIVTETQTTVEETTKNKKREPSRRKKA